MKSISLEKNGKKIRILGNQATIDRATPIIERLNLTGIESKDRLLIQNCIDDNKIGATILYDGNTVYSFNKIVDKYKKGRMYGVPIISREQLDDYHIDHVCITTHPGLNEAIQWCDMHFKEDSNCRYTIITSQQKS